MTGHIQVLTTVSSRDEANRIAQALVEKRLAACVQVMGPIQSTYHWQGAVETSQEWLCVAKSRRELYDRIEQAIREVHSYQVPEILALPIAAAGADYLKWLDEEVEWKTQS